MEYREVQYTLEEDGRGWRWSVVLGSPPMIKSGHNVKRGTAILKVWPRSIERSAHASLGDPDDRNGPPRDFGRLPQFIISRFRCACFGVILLIASSS
jgi:hypothetical protein